jgi:cytochrome c553
VQGQGTDNDYFPRLAGKPAGYLENQLVAFRDGRRRYAPMNYLLEYQNDAYPATRRTTCRPARDVMVPS